MASKVLSAQQKAASEYIKNGINESKDNDEKFQATDSEILFVITDYLVHPRDGVRKVAKRTGHSKTWVWRVLHKCPARFDDELAKLVFSQLHSNRMDVKGITTISANVKDHLYKARSYLIDDRNDTKHITKFKAKFILWF